MCRWLADSGAPVLLEELLHNPRYSLIDQSLHELAVIQQGADELRPYQPIAP
jgi:hypothetical protein